jgi:hypothetical protein
VGWLAGGAGKGLPGPSTRRQRQQQVSPRPGPGPGPWARGADAAASVPPPPPHPPPRPTPLCRFTEQCTQEFTADLEAKKREVSDLKQRLESKDTQLRQLQASGALTLLHDPPARC